MSLIPFHRGLITAAIVFCFGYGVWEILAYTRSESTGLPVIAPPIAPSAAPAAAPWTPSS